MVWAVVVGMFLAALKENAKIVDNRAELQRQAAQAPQQPLPLQ